MPWPQNTNPNRAPWKTPEWKDSLSSTTPIQVRCRYTNNCKKQHRNSSCPIAVLLSAFSIFWQRTKTSKPYFEFPLSIPIRMLLKLASFLVCIHWKRLPEVLVACPGEKFWLRKSHNVRFGEQYAYSPKKKLMNR